MAADVVSIVLRLEQVRQFVSGADRASTAVGKIGTAAEDTGQKAKIGWRDLAKFAGGAAALYGAQRFIRGAVTTTEDLGKATLTLQRTTGMDVETASQWAAVAKARGLSTKQLQVGFVKLSREMEKTRLATDKGATALGHLGLASEVQRGDTGEVINAVADALSRMENPAQRAALAQQLLGRGGQQLLPVLIKGRQGIQDQLAVVKRYGAYLGVKTVDELKEVIAHERELKIARQGVQVQLGTALMPLLLKFSGLLIKIARFLAPLTKNTAAFTAAIAALTLAFLAYKVGMVVTTLVQAGFNVQLLITLGIIGAVILVLAALVIGFIILYKKVGWFRDAVDATWGWIKKNWPLLLGILLGPFALAVVLIIKHFDKIKRFAQRFVEDIKAIFNRLVDFIKGIPGRVGSSLGRAGGFLGRVAGKVVPGLQSGGYVTGAGAALVGERGPELVRLPRGAAVMPLGGADRAPAAVGGLGGEIVVPVTLVLPDGQVLARTVARATADKLARR